MKQIIMVAKAALRTYSGCGPKLCGPKCQSAPCTMLQEEGFIYANKLTPEGGGRLLDGTDGDARRKF